jgi:hypothetical protein
MRESFPYAGRHVATEKTKSVLIHPDAGKVLALVEHIAGYEVINLYAKQAVVDRWGIRLIHPFHRFPRSNQSDYAEFFDEDIHIFCPARIQIIEEEPWMLKNEI